MTSSTIHIGTSGWHYRHWRGNFYPAGLAPPHFLEFYCRQFQTVEINNSFYRLPLEKTLAAWRAAAPTDFLFAVKAGRFLTHMKKLKDAAEPLDYFLTRIAILGDKLGPVLFQLPPRWQCNVERLTAFLALLPDQFRYAFEFRDESWFRQPVYDALRRANAAFCIYHLAGRSAPRQVTADFIYIRLHGPAAPYSGKYDDRTLAEWADAISAWQRQGKDVFCYFDNDQHGYAAANARRLAEILNQLA